MITAFSRGAIAASIRRAAASTGWTLTLAATGTGAGVASICVTTSAATTATLDGAGYFYSDAAGTLNQSQTWTLAAGANIRYIRLASGTAHLTFTDGSKITRLSGPTGYPRFWEAATNAPGCTFAASSVPSVDWIISQSELLTITGNIADLADSCVRLALPNATTMTGVFANAGALRLESNSPSGFVWDITGCTSLTHVSRATGGGVTGSISACTALVSMICWSGAQFTCSGDLSVLKACLDTYIRTGASTMTYPTTGVTHTGTKSRFIVQSQLLSQAEGDALVIDLSAATWVASGGQITLRVTGGLSGSAAVTAALSALSAKNVTVTIQTS